VGVERPTGGHRPSEWNGDRRRPPVEHARRSFDEASPLSGVSAEAEEEEDRSLIVSPSIIRLPAIRVCCGVEFLQPPINYCAVFLSVFSRTMLSPLLCCLSRVDSVNKYSDRRLCFDAGPLFRSDGAAVRLISSNTPVGRHHLSTSSDSHGADDQSGSAQGLLKSPQAGNFRTTMGRPDPPPKTCARQRVSSPERGGDRMDGVSTSSDQSCLFGPRRPPPPWIGYKGSVPRCYLHSTPTDIPISLPLPLYSI